MRPNGGELGGFGGIDFHSGSLRTQIGGAVIHGSSGTKCTATAWQIMSSDASGSAHDRLRSGLDARRNAPMLTPLIPALRSDAMAISRASRRKQIPWRQPKP
jgi:hypothetical protein